MKSVRLSSVLVVAYLALSAFFSFGQEVEPVPEVSFDVKHDVSLPLRNMAKTAHRTASDFAMIEPEIETRRNLGVSFGLPGEDTVVQDVYLPVDHTKRVLSIEGVREDQSSAIVPDTNGAVGATQFVEITNFDYEVFDKTTGKVILPPTNTNTIFQGFGGACEGTNPGDPVVLWDHLAQRWLVTYLNYTNSNSALCIAVSTSEDATGSYNRYAFDYGSNLADYPKYAVWPDAYYSATNFSAGAEPCAYDRNAMLAGKRATAVCFKPNNNDFSFLPSDLDGATLPPNGAPNHFVELGLNANLLTDYDFHVDFANPKKSTFTGPNNITVPVYYQACGGGISSCIPEPPPGDQVECICDRMLFPLAYRNFGDHESMVATQVVTPGKNSTAVSAMRWYELRSTPPGGAFSLYQAGTFQNKSTSLWMGSIGMDKAGDIALGMSASSSTVKPSIWYTGRLATDPLGKMEAPRVAVTGTAVQNGDGSRWGDYSSMSIDPSDDCTFWYSQMYYNKKHGGGSSADWSTRITAFRFDNCK
jgi:hypothetical protein